MLNETYSQESVYGAAARMSKTKAACAGRLRKKQGEGERIGSGEDDNGSCLEGQVGKNQKETEPTHPPCFYAQLWPSQCFKVT